MSRGERILVVDDDPHLRDIVRFALEKAGFQVVEAADGRQALERFFQEGPALIVLDILMPEMDGTDVCRAIRARSQVPIVFLSSRDDEVDRIVGLELGGDDYVTKPFSPRELVARVKAVLRRLGGGPTSEAPVAKGESAPSGLASVSAGGGRPELEPGGSRSGSETSDSARGSAERKIRHGRLLLDLDRFVVAWEGREVVFTVTEFGIVRTLLGYPGKVFSRDELMDGAYRDENVVSDRTIDSHVRRVRRKFAEVGGDPIETVHGVGYRLREERGA